MTSLSRKQCGDCCNYVCPPSVRDIGHCANAYSDHYMHVLFREHPNCNYFRWREERESESYTVAEAIRESRREEPAAAETKKKPRVDAVIKRQIETPAPPPEPEKPQVDYRAMQSRIRQKLDLSYPGGAKRLILNYLLDATLEDESGVPLLTPELQTEFSISFAGLMQSIKLLKDEGYIRVVNAQAKPPTYVISKEKFGEV